MKASSPAALAPFSPIVGSVDLEVLLVAWRERRPSEHSRRAYDSDLEDFRRFVGADSKADAARSLLSRGHGGANALVLAYREDLRARMSAGSVNRHLSSLREVVRAARTFGLVPWELEIPNLKGGGRAYRDTRGPGRSVVRAMLDALREKRDPKSIRDCALLRLLYDLGLRRGEVASLDLAHVDFTGSRVSVLRKGHAERTWLDLPALTTVAMRAWLELRGQQTGPFFTGFRGGKGKRLVGGGIYRTVRTIGREVGATVRPHGLRHTAITEAVKLAQAHGLSLEEVRDFSGHADVRTLMIYRDRERNIQGKLAALVAATTS